MRPFLKFDGEGETANARERAIGGHPAVLLRGVCRRRDPASPHADPDGYVPFGKLVNYAAGRSYDDAANRHPLGGYATTELRASWQFAPDWQVEARLANVFDRHY